MRAIQEALKGDSERVVDSKQRQALQQRAEAFKNKGSNMQQEILKHEEDAMRRTQYEKEAWNEVIEERKADIRQKTTAIIGKVAHAAQEAPKQAEPDYSKDIDDHAAWIMA